eukprot:3028276-Alexandrium_andersonii.AAC.1
MEPPLWSRSPACCLTLPVSPVCTTARRCPRRLPRQEKLEKRGERVRGKERRKEAKEKQGVKLKPTPLHPKAGPADRA